MALPDFTTQDPATYKANIDSTLNTGIVDVNGNEILKSVPAASATNEISVGNAVTGGDPYIIASGSSDTNVDIDIDGKGSGVIRTNGVRVHGMVILDTPETLVATTSVPPTAANVQETSATLDNANAVAAIIRITLSSTTIAGTSLQILAASSNITLNASRDLKAGVAEGNDTSCTFVINLDANNDFWWISVRTGTVSMTMYLDGYYV